MARTNAPAVGAEAEGLEYEWLDDRYGFAGGVVAFVGRLNLQASFNERALWAGTSSEDLVMIAREGDPAPGGGTFRSFADPRPFANGSVFFFADSRVGPTESTVEGLFLYTPGHGIEKIVLEYELTSGFTEGSTVYLIRSWASHPRRGLVYSITARRPDGSFRLGVFSQPGTPGEMPSKLISNNPTVYGTDWAVNLPGAMSLGADGSVYATTQIYSTELSQTQRNGVWRWHDDQLKLIAQGGQSAPGAGFDFGRLLQPNTSYPYPDAHGRAAFIYDTRPGIWFGGWDALRVVAVKGMPAPGSPANFKDFHHPFVGASGHLAFFAKTEFPEGVRTHSSGIWVRPIDGELRPLLETGDPVMLRGKRRFVAGVQLNRDDDVFLENRGQTPVNAQGDILFVLETTDDYSVLARARISYPHDDLHTEISLVNDEVVVRSPSHLGFFYQLEASDNGGDGNWEDVGEARDGDGSELELPCPISPEYPTRIFRIKITPAG